MKKSILLSLVLAGVLSANCVRNVDETVTCKDTNLMWQDDESAKTTEKTWKEAIEYCESLNFAGYSDWRLPNKNELLSIVDRSKSNPAINGAFKNTTSDVSNGNAFSRAKSVGNYVRCVRAGQ